ncbi:hypothetical protein AB0P21_20520 [Kribbella sp. NPDC056861]|uniref:hypothetical protein n=1 Tax=Kribbella sp. NPDC056861 TaxID=3154857 RepID=UPI003443D3EB
MTIKLRLSGEPGEIASLFAFLDEHYEVAGGNRTYPNRGSFGVRAYAELREHDDTDEAPQRVRSERVHPIRKEVEP